MTNNTHEKSGAKSGKKIAIVVAGIVVVLAIVLTAVLIPKGDSSNSSDDNQTDEQSQTDKYDYNNNDGVGEVTNKPQTTNPYLNDAINQYIPAKDSTQAEKLGWWAEWEEYWDGSAYYWRLLVHITDITDTTGYGAKAGLISSYFMDHDVYALDSKYHVKYQQY
jgi:hypothetical protein